MRDPATNDQRLQKLRAFMEEHDLTRAQLARCIRVGQPRVTRWLGRTDPAPAWIDSFLSTVSLADIEASKLPQPGRPALDAATLADKHAERVAAAQRILDALLVLNAPRSTLVVLFGVTRQAVSRWLTGATMPPPRVREWAEVILRTGGHP